MSNEISTSLSARSTQTLERGTPQAVASAKQSVAKVDIKVPEKAEIRYDPNEMRRNLEEAIQRLNEQMKKSAQNLNFSIDELANRTVITVKNTTTGEVVRQIPNETVLKVAHNIEHIKGMLHNART